jgi:hypothetical protein
MAHVMQQRSSACCNSICGIDRVSLAETIKHARHQVKRAE